MNTDYTEGCCRHSHYLRSFYSRDKKHGLHCAMPVDDCPAGWYITEETESGGYYNIYYHQETDPKGVPKAGWAVYKGQYSKPGFRPLPEVVVTEGCFNHRDGMCLCHDWHDMEMPHWHKVSPVDLAVKTVVVEGAFQLLEQAHRGAQQPHADVYIPIDIAGTDLYGLLCSMEALFVECGLRRDWGSASAKQRLRETFGTFLEEGSLKAEELDLFYAQSVYKYASRASLGAPLRLFDFLQLLGRVGSRAFPTEKTRSALSLTVAALRIKSPPALVHGPCLEEHPPSDCYAGEVEEDEEEEMEDMWPLFFGSDVV